MTSKEAMVSFAGAHQVGQHIHDIKRGSKKKKQDYISKKVSSNVEIEDTDNPQEGASDPTNSKSLTFLSSQTDLKGSDLFGFRTPSRTNSLRKTLSNSANKSFKSIKNKKVVESSNSESSDDDDNDDKELNDDNPDDDDDDDDDISKKKTPRSSKNKKINECKELDVAVIDEFFEQEKSSLKTSDRTLSRLPKMDPAELQDLLEAHQFPYEEERRKLSDSYRKYFNEWMINMSYGSNILLYGLGSKINILDNFAKEILSGFPLIIVNGFFPGLTFKSILSSICELFDINMNSLSTVQISAIIKKYLLDNDIILFLIIHNIDGLPLRNEKAQHDLSLLARIKNIHLVASIDHINAPLLWDQTKLNRFSFLWYDVTTFNFYSQETSYENSLLISGTGALQLNSLGHILGSLTENAKKIFLILAVYQLDGLKDAYFQGYGFEELYMKCREEFLVNSEATLRAQLSEFIDHKLVKIKKGADGAELVSIMLDNSNLSQYVSNQEEEI